MTPEEKQAVMERRKELFGERKKVEADEPEAYTEVLRFTATHSPLPKILSILRDYTNEEVKAIADRYKEKKRKKAELDEAFRKEREVEREIAARMKLKAIAAKSVVEGA